jgi:hypothetical protein
MPEPGGKDRDVRVANQRDVLSRRTLRATPEARRGARIMRGQPTMLTAHVATRITVTIEITGCASIKSFAGDVSGTVSAALKAGALVNDR